ncbi:MAG: preprotein translocase subunit SecG [Prolixibacteraceae bacterium]|nr:preprotein translocase subunit SecG [Prolixibacteraceae bacterium]
MYILITILIFIVCILLVLIVLVQNSKGGGLASNFQSSGQVMGVRKTTDFLEKATWTLAALLLVLAIAGSASIPRNKAGVDQSMIQEQIDNAIDPTTVPNFPTAAPTTNTQTSDDNYTDEDNQ